MPNLLVGVFAYLVALPFLPAQAGSLALVALTAMAVLQPRRETPPVTGNLMFLYSLVPFLAARLLAVCLSPVPARATAVTSYFLPGLVLFYIAMQHRAWKPRAWMLVWTAFCAVLSLSVVIGWVRLQLGAAVPPEADIPQAVLLLSGNQLLLVPNDLCAGAVGIAFPLALLVAPGSARPVRAAAMLAILLTLFAMTILRTRAGFVVCAAELMVFALAWRPLLLLALPAGLGVVAAADWRLHLHFMERLASASSLENHGILGRLGLWNSAWRMFVTAPVMGHGAQSFGPMHAAFMPAWSPPFPERHVLWAHSLYLETVSEQGMIGITALLALLLQPAYHVWHEAASKFRGNEEKLAALTAAAVLLGFALAAALEFSFVRPVVSLMLFGVLGFAWRVCNASPHVSLLQKSKVFKAHSGGTGL